jgi:hypothetical protein
MGEIRVWKDKEEYIDVLEREIAVLKTRYNPDMEGTGHYNTAISVLEARVDELRREITWPFPV